MPFLVYKMGIKNRLVKVGMQPGEKYLGHRVVSKLKNAQLQLPTAHFHATFITMCSSCLRHGFLAIFFLTLKNLHRTFLPVLVVPGIVSVNNSTPVAWLLDGRSLQELYYIHCYILALKTVLQPGQFSG